MQSNAKINGKWEDEIEKSALDSHQTLWEEMDKHFWYVTDYLNYIRFDVKSVQEFVNKWVTSREKKKIIPCLVHLWHIEVNQECQGQRFFFKVLNFLNVKYWFKLKILGTVSLFQLST